MPAQTGDLVPHAQGCADLEAAFGPVLVPLHRVKPLHAGSAKPKVQLDLTPRRKVLSGIDTTVYTPGGIEALKRAAQQKMGSACPPAGNGRCSGSPPSDDVQARWQQSVNP